MTPLLITINSSRLNKAWAGIFYPRCIPAATFSHSHVWYAWHLARQINGGIFAIWPFLKRLLSRYVLSLGLPHLTCTLHRGSVDTWAGVRFMCVALNLSSSQRILCGKCSKLSEDELCDQISLCVCVCVCKNALTRSSGECECEFSSWLFSIYISDPISFLIHACIKASSAYLLLIPGTLRVYTAHHSSPFPEASFTPFLLPSIRYRRSLDQILLAEWK